MDLQPVFARAAGIVADIHHSHGIKAALAVSHLHDRFPDWTPAFWQGALTRAGWFEAPVVDRAVATAGPELLPERARVAIARAVVPQAYGAVRAWAAARGADDIVRFYIDQACTDPDYLGHRLSVLLALGEAWPFYQDGPQRELYLDRLTEFLLACHFKVANEGQPCAPASWEQACAAALTHPGFFGHHLIGLAWIGRQRARLSEAQLRNALGWVVAAAARTYPDAEDNVTIAPAACDVSDSALEPALRALLQHGTSNIHLLTFADAIAWLWDHLGHEARPSLAAAARLYVTGTP
jgi:hypothetical protein